MPIHLQNIDISEKKNVIKRTFQADVTQVGSELVVSGLDSAMSLIQTARNLLGAVVQTVKAAYIASTKVWFSWKLSILLVGFKRTRMKVRKSNNLIKTIPRNQSTPLK